MTTAYQTGEVQTVAQGMSMAQALIGSKLDPQTAAQFEHIRVPFKLRPHQYVSLQALLAWDRVGLFDDPRTGKTCVMQLAAIFMHRFGMRSIFLTPPALFDQFVEDFYQLEGHGLNMVVLNASAKARKETLQQIGRGKIQADTLLMTKEIFKLHLLELVNCGYKALFFDECHMGLQSEALLTKKAKKTTYSSVKYFVDTVPEARLILSTGTPIYSNLSGTYPIISLKTPEAYLSRFEFEYHHVSYKPITVQTRWGMKTKQIVDNGGYENLELLHKNLYKQAVRALKLEVLDIDVPNIQQIPVHLHDSHKALYRKAIKERVLEVEEELIDLRQQQQLRAFALQMITTPSIATDKKLKNAVLEAVQALLDTTNVKHNKVLLFANFNKSVVTLAGAFRKYNPAIIYGPNGPGKNRDNISKFKTDASCRIAVANPVAGGVGLTFGKVSQTVIVVEPMSVYGQFDQAVSRVILEGQEQPVVVYILRILNTISPKAIELMLEKTKLIKEVTKDRKTVLDELLGEI